MAGEGAMELGILISRSAEASLLLRCLWNGYCVCGNMPERPARRNASR
jgi:hypothetical protein